MSEGVRASVEIGRSGRPINSLNDRRHTSKRFSHTASSVISDARSRVCRSPRFKHDFVLPRSHLRRVFALPGGFSLPCPRPLPKFLQYYYILQWYQKVLHKGQTALASSTLYIYLSLLSSATKMPACNISTMVVPMVCFASPGGVCPTGVLSLSRQNITHA